VLADLLRCLRTAKDKQWSVAEVQAGLKPVRENAELVALEVQDQAPATIDTCDLDSLAAQLES
jgi:hypothetical protein